MSQLQRLIRSATAQLEETMLELKKNYTIVIVTHSMQQAARASDYTGFFYLGSLIEYDKTSIYFPKCEIAIDQRLCIRVTLDK